MHKFTLHFNNKYLLIIIIILSILNNDWITSSALCENEPNTSEEELHEYLLKEHKVMFVIVFFIVPYMWHLGVYYGYLPSGKSM